jgi:enoyl-CoA hydratase/carnithine racemase
MSTHEQTMTDSPDEPPTPASETPPMNDEAATEAPTAEPPSVEHESADEMLFAGDDLAELRARWAGVQAAFVDDPKDCVQKADALVSDLVEQLTSGFAETRSRLEEQWHRGEEASTEDLRLSLMHYREFFERLLAV